MKFCMVTSFFGAESFGGDALYVERLSHALLKRGHEVHVVHSAGAFRCVQGRHERRAYQAPAGLEVHTLARGPAGIAAALWSHQTGRLGPIHHDLSRLLAEVPFDVLHLHNVSLMGHTHVFDLLPPGRRPVKLVTAHDYWWICPQSLLWKYNQRVCEKPACATCLLRIGRPPQWWRGLAHPARSLSRAGAVLFPSASSLHIHAAHGLRLATAKVLPCFVPDEWSTCATTSAPQARPYVAAVGRLVTEKGFQTIVPLMREFPELELRLAGSGPLGEELRRMSPPNVTLLGQIGSGEVAALISGARALIVPSLFPEPFGYVAVEAMALGTPVIAARLGALPELLEAAGGGCLFDSLDELRAHLRALMVAEPEARTPDAELAAAAARAWSESAHIDRYLDIIKSLQ